MTIGSLGMNVIAAPFVDALRRKTRALDAYAIDSLPGRGHTTLMKMLPDLPRLVAP